MIQFNTDSSRYEVSDWSLRRNGERITDASVLSKGDAVKFHVSFLNLKIDKECVLMIRYYHDDTLCGMSAQEITIFPDVLTFNIATESFTVPESGEGSRIELLLSKDFSTVTEDEECRFLIGKSTGGIEPARLEADTSHFREVSEELSENPSIYIGDYEPCKRLFNGAVCFAQDSDGLWIKNAKYRAEKPTVRKDKKLWIPSDTANKMFGIKAEGEYIPLDELAERLGAYSYENRFGLGVISDLPYDYSETKYLKQTQFMVRLIAYDRPKAREFKKRFLPRVRPRAMGYRYEIERMIKLSETNKDAAWLSDLILGQADKFMEAPVQYKLDRGREQSGFITAIVDYAEILALYWAYIKREDKKYLTRLKEHILAMCGLEHWCGDHFFLMTSRALVSCALAYEFLYDEFTENERKAIAEAMVEKGFKPAMVLYYGNADEACWPWCIRRTNWNIIPNSGIIFAAAVLFDEYETDICADVLEKAVQSLEYACIYFAPDGEWYEGIGYASYSWNYLVFALQALENNFGTAFHLDTSAGMRNCYKIPYTSMTATGFYSQGDASTSMKLDTTYTLWSARRYGDHNIQCMRHMQIAYPINGSVPKFTDLLWFDEEASPVAQLELDYLYESSQTVLSRSSWDKNAAVLSVHAGDNSMEHGHADMGSFEFEINGFRFAREMGIDGEVYCTPGSRYMLRRHDDYYVARAEGHNVYVINPDMSVGQSKNGKSPIYTISKDADNVAYMVDMESAYRGQVKEAKRYYELRENRSVLVVQDEIVPMKAGDEVYWFWHTFAQIRFSDPRAVEINDNTATLTAPDGQRLSIRVDANVPFVLRRGMSVPLETSPAPFDQLQGGIISNLLTIYFKTEDTPIILRVCAKAENNGYEPGDLTPFCD